jgi:DNA-binding LytR/AlgR family response regulator
MMATAGALPIRTVIVDDEPPARTRLRSLLEEDPEIEIVASAMTARGPSRPFSSSSQRWYFSMLKCRKETGSRC